MSAAVPPSSVVAIEASYWVGSVGLNSILMFG